MNIFREDEGQVLALTSLCMVAVLGFAGMAADVGMLFHDKREQQTIADAVALSAAVDYKDNASVSMAQTAGQAAATKNGLTDLSYLTVNVPPQSAPFAATSGFVEAVLTEPRSTYFMRLFGVDNVNVTARAVASINGLPADGCIYVLNPTAPEAMDVQGSFNLDAPGCGVEVGSSASNALYFGGAGGSLTAQWVSVTGGDGGQVGDSTPAPMINTHAIVNDPYGGLTGPTPGNGGCSSSGYSWTLNGTSGTTKGSTDTTTTTLTGNYAGPGDSTAICFTQPVTLSNVVLGPGIYVFENGVTLQNSVTGIGVTLDVYSGSLTIPTGGVSFGSATATTPAQAASDGLVAPTDGPTNGIAIMEPPSNSSTIQIQKGNATGNITGAIYMPNPNSQLYLQDSGGDLAGGISVWGDVIVGTLFDKTTTFTIHAYSDVAPATDPLRGVVLVE